jgi:hypothetical protein
MRTIRPKGKKLHEKKVVEEEGIVERVKNNMCTIVMECEFGTNCFDCKSLIYT